MIALSATLPIRVDCLMHIPPQVMRLLPFAAVAAAAAWLADRLIFLSDVEGVRGASGAVLSSLTSGDAEELVASGIATGGMVAKLRAARQAVARGIPAVEIASGHSPRILHRLMAGEECGTRMRN